MIRRADSRVRRTRVRGLAFVAPALILLATVGPAEPLLLGGKPLHPECVRNLVVPWSDRLAPVAAVHVEACNASDSAWRTIEDMNGLAVARDPDSGSFFGYRPIGKTPGGIHAFYTAENGGGSLTVVGILVVRFVRDRILVQEYETPEPTDAGAGDEAAGEGTADAEPEDVVVVAERTSMVGLGWFAIDPRAEAAIEEGTLVVRTPKEPGEEPAVRSIPLDRLFAPSGASPKESGAGDSGAR